MSIVIAGSGAFGTGLAIALAESSPVTLLGRDQAVMNEVQSARVHPNRLPGVQLPANITATADNDVLADAETVLLCVPTQQLSGFLNANSKAVSGKALLACCKGIELTTLRGTAQVISTNVPSAIAGVLTGPSFAADIARGLPTALTLATENDADGERLQTSLTRPNLRIYRTTDVTGAQLGGALKNVVAIAAGVCIGAGLGESARAALITRGFAEMQKLASVLGARSETLMGLSGLGDLILTCSSEQSRNYSYGLSIGRVEDFDPKVTVEGAATAKAVTRIAEENSLDLPVTRVVADLVSGNIDPQQALTILLSRPLKEE